jgi:hypothetical protein
MQQRLGEALSATPRTETILGCMDHCARVLREISVVAFGSIAALLRCPSWVRFTPDSDQIPDIPVGRSESCPPRR